MRARRTKNLLTIAAAIAGYLLLSSNLSWGDTTIYVYQAASSGALTIKAIDCDGNKATPTQTVAIPNSCFTPTLFWDSAVGALRLNGFDSLNNPSWTGTIDATGMFTTTMAPPLPTVNCSSVSATVEASVVNAAFPDKIPCTGYTWTACSGGVMTRTGATPPGCVSDQPTMLSCVSACTSWSYGSWTPASCAAGTIQSRTATGIPSGCVGLPDALTVQSCPPQACTSYNYTVGTCQPNNTAPVTGYTGVPAGCSGGATPATTQPCTYNAPTCTSWTYTAWSPSEAACTAGQTLTRSVLTSSPNPCNGGNSVVTEACPNVPPGSGTALKIGDTASKWTVPAGGTYLFSASLPSACTTSAKQLRFSVTGQQTSPNVDIVIKKGSQPTRTDYQNLFGISGITAGQYTDCVKASPSATTCTGTGTYFWNFSGTGSGETTIVYADYSLTPPTGSVKRWLNAPINAYASVPNFSQAGTYYMLLVNTSSTTSTLVNAAFFCY